MTLAAIQESIQPLPSSDKVALIDWLWENLDSAQIARREQLWAAEAEDCIDAVERGALSTVDGPAALGRLRQSLRV